MLDKRLNDKGKNWRHVLKSLKVLDYCLHEGSELVVTWARKNIYIIKTLREFQYIDEDGKDVGQNGGSFSVATSGARANSCQFEYLQKNLHRSSLTKSAYGLRDPIARTGNRGSLASKSTDLKDPRCQAPTSRQSNAGNQSDVGKLQMRTMPNTGLRSRRANMRRKKTKSGGNRRCL